jgi:hypothetical protein
VLSGGEEEDALRDVLAEEAQCWAKVQEAAKQTSKVRMQWPSSSNGIRKMVAFKTMALAVVHSHGNLRHTAMVSIFR